MIAVIAYVYIMGMVLWFFMVEGSRFVVHGEDFNLFAVFFWPVDFVRFLWRQARDWKDR